MSKNRLWGAIQQALCVSVLPATALALGCNAMPAVAQSATQSATTPSNNGKQPQTLQTIVVTGSHIRRVDLETSNPVTTVSAQEIKASGKVNLGDLIQQLPSMAGEAMNPQVNNGGNGQAGVSLRGLGSNRTLLMINGHRIPAQIQDLNMIPLSAVERVEVLKDGASAAYGSDAIGGVVNIITKTNYQGAEFGADYGISDRDDGQRESAHFLMGQTSDKGSILMGLQYDKQDPVSAANRNYSKNAQYIYNTGILTTAGSSRTPGGRFHLTNGKATYGCPSVTLSGSQLPSQTTPPTASEFRCYDAATDAFNFQAVGNYDLIPNERTGLFVLGNYQLTDNIQAYSELLYHKMVAHSQLAPYPFDLEGNNLQVPANQYYNPFGVGFGYLGNTDDISLRLTPLGNRGEKIATTDMMGNFGLKGNIGQSSWSWNAGVSYGKLTQETQVLNYLDVAAIAPDFSCTTAPGAGACTPIDIFNLSDPSTQAILESAKINPYANTLYQMKSGEVSANGSLFSLPAGDAQLAVGLSDRKEYLNSQVDPLLNSTFSTPGGVPTISCPGPGSICSSPAQGGYSVKEAYAELFIPIVKDMPFVHALNVDLGDRYSKYSNVGSTNNWKIAVEYRPIQDLLLRATVSKVFRTPSPTDLYGGPAADAPVATDPCAGSPQFASNPACKGFSVPPQSVYQLSGYVMGSVFAAEHNLLYTGDLLPEHGKSFDYGFVYDPHFVPGLSVNADYYRIVLDNLITAGAGIAQTILTQCFNQGGAICSDIVRNPDGSIKFVSEIAFNSGNLTAEGLDYGAHYRLPTNAWGAFTLGVEGTYIQRYDVSQGGFTQGLAGHYDRTYGNFARNRGLVTVDWTNGPWMAHWQTRYVAPIKIGYALASLGPSGLAGSGPGLYVPNPIGPVVSVPSVTTSGFSVGYDIKPINTVVQFGVDNVFDRQPPMMYLNDVLNDNTDVNTYDSVGRYYHASVTVKF